MTNFESFLQQLPYTRQPASLYEPIRYTLAVGGKRLRPQLMMMAYSLWRDHPADIYMQAAAIETYHNYTLLHDDLMDRADVRRGQPTVHRKWNDNQAILSGDTMLCLAYQRLATGADPARLPQLLSLFTTTALEICEGQQMDMEFETRSDVTQPEYMEMIRLKTSVLLACALKMGAILAGAPQQDAALLYDFGQKIGLSFQLQDDFLDVYGDPAVFGKAIGGDIMCGKKTFMLINAFQQADAATRQELQRWIDDSQAPRHDKVAAVTEIYNRLGIDRLARQEMERHYEEAIACLDRVAADDSRKEALRQYAQGLYNRAR